MSTDAVPTIILCGGQGTRMRGVSEEAPKPLLPIGGRPILWHIMQIYASHGFRDFVLALGHQGDAIRQFALEAGADGALRIGCADTGLHSLTGTRVRRAADQVDGDPLMVTYGDGVGDVDVRALVEFHRAHGRLATVTAVRPPRRFGELAIGPDGYVRSFDEKPDRDSGAINGGFMVFAREAIERYIGSDDVMLEREPLSAMAKDGELVAYRHDGFWHHMDTPHEWTVLEELWASGRAPWQTWE